MGSNLLIMHGGGPTAVLNASLYGAVHTAKQYSEIKNIWAAAGGSSGIIKRNFFDMHKLSDYDMQKLLHTPGSAIGTGRDVLESMDYEIIAQRIEEYEIDAVLCNGGNGTMDTCGKIYHACRKRKKDVKVIGIPKTMDNDLGITDHSPGYASAARYMAGSIAELSADVHSLPIHIVVLEAMGRNAGWVAAASALASDSGVPGPDLIYLPEMNFNENQFLEDVQKIIRKKGCGVVVASEGLKNRDGKLLVKPVFQKDRSVYFGDVSTHLALLITKKLGYKARAEKPGLLGRASVKWQSQVDVNEAIMVASEAVHAVMRGESGKMVTIERVSNNPYKMKTGLADIEQVMLHERKMPREFINANANGVTQAFCDWCRPLLGEPLSQMANSSKWNTK